jgi:N-acetylmuramoyl-L-alanine amidase
MRRACLATALSVLALCAAPVLPEARAELGASGTRISVTGARPRFYMTYGHVAEQELYAPILDQLERLQVTFRIHGDDALVYRKGVKKATWPVVREREDVPETGEDPCVLVFGGHVFVPVRALSELLHLDVEWEKRANLISLGPARERRRPLVALPNASKIDAGLRVLSAVEVERKGARAIVRVRSNGPVRARWASVGYPRPYRIVIDFMHARWADEVRAPAAGGDVQQLRLGRFTPTTARLVLQVPNPQVKVTALNVTQDGMVTASIGRGAEARAVRIHPQAAALIRKRERAPKITHAANVPTQPAPPADTAAPTTHRPKPEHFPDLKVRPAGSLRGRVIVVDAGHGGHDGGARGSFHREKDLCLQMIQQFGRSLAAQGASVIFTRRSDDYVSLETRCAIANRSNADLFISIHLNSTVPSKRNTVSGTETYWRNSVRSLRLARALHRRVVRAVGKADRGVRNRSFHVIRETKMPSVLLEIGYINNTSDEQLLASPAFHKRLAATLTRGVLDYFGTDLVASNSEPEASEGPLQGEDYSVGTYPSADVTRHSSPGKTQ